MTLEYGTSVPGGSVLSSGPDLFGSITGAASGSGKNYAGPGDSIRICYGIDNTQGGRNQSTGFAETTWFQISQAFDPKNTTRLVDVGLVSIHGAVVDSLQGDACYSSTFDTDPLAPGTQQGFSTGVGAPPGPVLLETTLSFASIVGTIPGTTTPAPFVWDVAFEFIGSTGVTTPTTLGSDPLLPGCPLLTNVIFEVQGPVNGGVSNNQYYLASTVESLGVGDGSGNATGGVTNGNGLQGMSLWGLSAQPMSLGGSGALSHNRLTGFTPAAGLVGTTSAGSADADKQMWAGGLAFRTPGLWGSKIAGSSADTGGGASDWRISSAPVSIVNLRSLDVTAGAEGASLAGSPGATSLDEPGLVFNAPVFLISGSSHPTMLQKPFSWTPGGLGAPCIPGSLPQPTTRAGFQLLPLAFTTVNFFGSDYAVAFDPGLGEPDSTLFEFGQGTSGEGMATLSTDRSRPQPPRARRCWEPSSGSPPPASSSTS